MIHPSSDVQSNQIGRNTNVWQFCVVLPKAKIGDDCNICSHCFIENDVVIGNRVTVKCGVQIWDGVSIEDDVFIGPNVTFCNDLIPRSRQPFAVARTRLRQGASIGANATILPGLSIGESAFIAAGSVVTKDVKDFAVMVGSPARRTGWLCGCGNKIKTDTSRLVCNCGRSYELEDGKLVAN